MHSESTNHDSKTVEEARAESPDPRFELVTGVTAAPLDVAGDEPSFMVETPANRRFKVSGGVHEVIRLLDQAGGPLTIDEIVERLRSNGAESATAEKVDWLLKKVLLPREVVISEDLEAVDQADLEVAKKPSSYIWLKLPLLHEKLVGKLTGPLAFFFRAPVAALFLGAAVLAHLYFYLRILPGFELGLSELTVMNVVIIMAITNVTTMFHELGHASASRRFGVAPGPIGWGIYFFMFVLYADVSRIWRLKRWQRAVVDAGGMYFELIASSALVLYLASTGHTVVIYAVLLINLNVLFSFNPVLRRDGYWILTDLSGQENLRYASNQVLSAWSRRLFGRGEATASTVDRRAGWLQSMLGLYSVASVAFSLFITVWLGQRIFRDVIPQIGTSFGSLTEAWRLGSFSLDALTSVGQILFGLVFVSIVLFSAWAFVRTIVAIAMPGAVPEHTAGARVEWK